MGLTIPTYLTYRIDRPKPSMAFPFPEAPATRLPDEGGPERGAVERARRLCDSGQGQLVDDEAVDGPQWVPEKMELGG